MPKSKPYELATEDKLAHLDTQIEQFMMARYRDLVGIQIAKGIIKYAEGLPSNDSMAMQLKQQSESNVFTMQGNVLQFEVTIDILNEMKKSLL